MTPRDPRRTRRGFTLVEMIATIVILGAMGSVASSVLLSATDRYLDAATAAQLNTEASVGLDRIARELRRIGRDTAATGVAPDIDNVTDASIAWSGNNSIAMSGGGVKLIINGSSARQLMSDVSAFAVAVYDESDAAVTLPASGDDCDPIRRVAVSVTLERHGVAITLRTRVYLRSTLSGAGQ